MITDKYSHYDGFKRKPTSTEKMDLALAYMDHFDCSLTDAHTATMIGDGLLDSGLTLTKGEQYSRVEYNSELDRFYWNHNMIAQVKPEYTEDGDLIEPEPTYDAQDAACDRYHERKDNQN